MSTPENNAPAVVNDNEETPPVTDPPGGQGKARNKDRGGETGNGDGTAPGEDDIRSAKRLLEALLFASAEPLSERVLANRIADGINVRSALKSLQSDYEARGVNLVRVGGSWAFRTARDLGALLNVKTEVARKMSKAGIETMAVIAYHQPVTRAEIEEIRGVSLGKGTLDLLFEKEWIKPAGRRETPGRPMMWSTTDVFLDHFGLSRLTDLPGLDELKAAGLLESSPALNVYRSRADEAGEIASADPETGTDGRGIDSLTALTGRGSEDALPEIEDTPEPDDPLDPDPEQ